jgi:hypothetical protein
MDDLFSGQSVEVEGKVIFDFSGSPGDIFARRLYVDGNRLNDALIKLNLVDRETKVKITIETL